MVCDTFRLHEEVAPELRVDGLLHGKDEWTEAKRDCEQREGSSKDREEKAQGT